MNEPKTFKEWAVSKIVGLDFVQAGEPKTLVEFELAQKAGLDVTIPDGMRPKTPIEYYLAFKDAPSDGRLAIAGIAIAGIAICGYIGE